MALTRTSYSPVTVGTANAISLAALTPPDNSLLVVFGMGQRDASTAFAAANITLADTAPLTWSRRVFSGGSFGYNTELVCWTAPVATGVSTVITATKGATDVAPQRWWLKALAYTGYDTSSPVGVSLASNAGATDGAYNPALSGAPAATSDVLALLASTVANSGLIVPVAGTGWTELENSCVAGNYAVQLQSRVGSAVASVLWDDVLGPSSTDVLYDASDAIAIEIKAAPAVPKKYLRTGAGVLRAGSVRLGT